VRKWTEYRSCSESANCGMEQAVQWRGHVLRNKIGKKRARGILFVSILPLKLLHCFESILLPVHRPPMGLYRIKINKDQI